jgi:DNA-binding MarR family transcriptional regulator
MRRRAPRLTMPADNASLSRFPEPSASPGFVLWQVAITWQRAIRHALEPLGLTHAQFVLLASSAWLTRERGHPPVTQRDIAEHARTDAVMTSEVLRALEKMGYLERRPHPDDARARCIEVTATGRRLARRAFPVVEAVDARFFATATPELRALAGLLSPVAAPPAANSRAPADISR